jgi:DNA-binding CsgD family transcriptional regulator
MLFERFLRWFKHKIRYRHPPSFEEELNHQCRLLIFMAYVLSCVSWLPFIPLDVKLYPDITIIPFFRWGFTVIGILTMTIHFVPLFSRLSPYFAKHKHYILYFIIVGYLEISSAIILGLVKADPAYIGGYCMIILLLPLSPFKIKHSLNLMGTSITIFLVVSLLQGVSFEHPHKMYGLVNFVLTLMMAIIAIIVLGSIRRHSYSNSLLIQERTDEKIEKFFIEKNISKRESEIVRLVLGGYSNNEIEKKLFISLTTVKSHIYKAYQKIGVKNRVQLIHLMQNIKKEW